MSAYRFYGWETANVRESHGLTPREIYDLLLGAWSEDTCAPRMRRDWPSSRRIFSAAMFTACPWRTAISTASTAWTAACST